MLEGVGLISVSPFGASSPVKGKRTLGRSASFGCGSNKGSTTGDVRLGAGVWAEEALRGLGIGPQAEVSEDVLEEEVRAIWERENVRLRKETAAAEAKAAKPSASPVFDEAMEC